MMTRRCPPGIELPMTTRMTAGESLTPSAHTNLVTPPDILCLHYLCPHQISCVSTISVPTRDFVSPLFLLPPEILCLHYLCPHQRFCVSTISVPTRYLVSPLSLSPPDILCLNYLSRPDILCLHYLCLDQIFCVSTISVPIRDFVSPLSLLPPDILCLYYLCPHQIFCVSTISSLTRGLMSPLSNISTMGSGDSSVVDHRTCDQKVTGSSPGRSGWIISSPLSTFCADSYFGIRFTPVLPQ